MKKFLIVIVLFTVSFTSFSQGGATSAPSNFESTSQIYDIIRKRLNDEKVVTYDLSEVIGSPYYDKNFLPGQMYLGEKSYGDFLFRYNVFRDEIEIKTNANSPLESIKKVKGISVRLNNNTTIELKNIKDDNNIIEHFLIKLANGKYTLAKKVNAKFDAPEKANSPLSGDKKGKFSTYEQFYVLNNTKSYYVILSKKKKEFINMFPENKTEVEQYIKDEKINLKKEDHLIKLFNYLNKL